MTCDRSSPARVWMFEPPNNSTRPAHDRNPRENLPSDSEDAPKSRDRKRKKPWPEEVEKDPFHLHLPVASVGGWPYNNRRGRGQRGNLILNYFDFFTILTNIFD